MRPVWIRALPILILVQGCEAELVEPEDTALLEMGSLFGQVSLSVQLQPSELDSLYVFVSVEEHPTEILAHRIYHVPMPVPLLNSGPVDYSIHNLFPQTAPYFVIALLDRDDSVGTDGRFSATAGDVLSVVSVDEQQEIVVESGAEIEVNLSLDFLIE
jgi:hypothetical protein